ncbi:ABC transporter [Lysobacteraceae bacterium NML03-0222]|nr:ABC transporter [Xanthomonadaceae bacterium NML03-0222]
MKHGFFSHLIHTLKTALTDKGVLLLWLIAPLLYGFFYPWPYQHERVEQVPVAVVDMDNSSLSRQIIRYAAASPELQVNVLPSEGAARDALAQRRIEGYALIPAGLKRDVSHGRPVEIALIGNGSYFMLNKSALSGLATAVATVSAGIEIRQLRALGLSEDKAQALREPVKLQSAALFNRHQGYGSSLVPAVAVLILQQTLLMAAGMWVAGQRERGERHVPGRIWAARISALALPNTLIGLFYFGWLFVFQGYAHGGNLAGAALLLPAFSLAVAGIGCLFGLWLADREAVMQVLLVTALPLFFLSGYSWPAAALPEVLQWLRWLTPSTPAIHASVALNQMGATLAMVAPLLGVLLVQGLLAFALLCLITRRVR